MSGRQCSICTRPDRAEVDKRIADGAALRRIAADTGAAETSLRRHRDRHIGAMVAAAVERQEAVEELRAEDLLRRVGGNLRRIESLRDRAEELMREATNNREGVATLTAAAAVARALTAAYESCAKLMMAAKATRLTENDEHTEIKLRWPEEPMVVEVVHVGDDGHPVRGLEVVD